MLYSNERTLKDNRHKRTLAPDVGVKVKDDMLYSNERTLKDNRHKRTLAPDVARRGEAERGGRSEAIRRFDLKFAA